LKQTLLIILATLGFANVAHAECPEEAVQTLYNVRANIYAGQEKDIKKVYGWADQAMQQCSDNSDVMAQAAELFFIVGENIPDNKNKFLAYSNGYQAIINNGKSYDNTASTAVVKFADGTEKKLYTYNSANVVSKKIVPALAELHINGYPHEIFQYSYSSQKKCPHISESRTLEEAEFLRKWAGTDGKKLWPAVHRVNGLHVTCPDYRPGLSYHLAIMNNRQAHYYAFAELWEKAITHAKRSQKHITEYLPHAKKYPTMKSYLLPKKLQDRLTEYQEKLNQTQEN